MNNDRNTVQSSRRVVTALAAHRNNHGRVTGFTPILLLASVLAAPLALAGESGSGDTTRPPPEGSAGSAPAPAPEIKPIGGGTITLEPINAPPVKREDAPGNKFVYDPACEDPFVYC